MTMTNEQLAADIKRVMELDAKRTQGEWLPFPWRKMPHGADPGEGGFINNGQLFHDGSENGHEEIGHFDSDADLDFGASAPRMADIIRQLTDIVRAQHEVLMLGQQFDDSVFWGESGERNKRAAARGYGRKRKAALALSAPLVKEEV